MALSGRHFTVHPHHITNLHQHLQNSFHLPPTVTSSTHFINSAITYNKTIFDSHTGYMHFSNILKLTTHILNLFPNHLHFTSTGTKIITHAPSHSYHRLQTNN